MDGEAGEGPNLFPAKVGDKLRDARLAQGLELADVAARTRVPLRHLTAIEASDYSGLPSPTYAIGFVKAYARAVGADEAALARDLRAETEASFAARETFESYDPEDPVREPPKGLAWAGVIVAVLVLIGVGIWAGGDWLRGIGAMIGGSAPAPTPVASATPEAMPSAAPTPETGGQVTLTATQPVWLRIYDAAGARLYEKEMLPGERYDVPGDAQNPMINLGRPEAVLVAIDGVEVAPLGQAGVAIKDVPISADALRARGQPGAVPTPTPVATGATGSGGTVPQRSRPAPARTSAPPRVAPTAAPTPTVTVPAPAPTAADSAPTPGAPGA